MATLEKLEHNMGKITMEIAPDVFEEACERAYQKNKSKISLPGFRKGKAPRKMIEHMYGKGVFYEDAVNDCLPDIYMAAIKETNADVVSRPEIDIQSMEEGCPIVVTATVALKPEVTLGKYKGLKAEKETVAVTEDDVMDELKKQAERNARLVDVTDRPAALEDEAMIDFEGFVDDRAFDGGKGTDYKLTLGTHTFVDNFEDQIVGHNVGDSFDVHVTFPEDYHAELAGKPALFKVTLKGLQKKQLPELDDDYAKDYSEFETMAEYKEDMHKKLLENKQKAADEAMKKKLVAEAANNATIDIPDVMVETRIDTTIENMANQMRYQGFTLDQYLQMTGSNLAKLREDIKEGALKGIREELTLEAIAKAEKIEVTDADCEERLTKMAEMYGIEVEKLKENIQDSENESLKEQLLNEKAQDWLVENSK